MNFLRQFAPAEPGARSRELRRAYRELSCLAQLRLAELLRSAEDNSLPNWYAVCILAVAVIVLLVYYCLHFRRHLNFAASCCSQAIALVQ